MLARAPEIRLITPLLGALVALAWLTLGVWGLSPYRRYLDHQYLEEATEGGPLVLLVFVAGWTLMIVAMMLPTVLPLVAVFRGIVHQRPDRRRLVALLLVGYLATWSLFGLLIHLADAIVHEVVEQSAWLEAQAWLLGAAVLLGAGLYQFTPLKYHCLDQCRSPFTFIAARWRGRNEAGQAFRLGVDHGLFCIGCCWSLMLLMFAVGTANLGWMLLLGAIMAIEKNVRWGRRLSAPLGVLLTGWGVLVLLAAAPAPVSSL